MTGISGEHNASAGPAGGRRDAPLIRKALPGDAAGIAHLLADALGAKYRPTLGRRAAAALEEVIRAELERGGHGYWIAERDARVVGSAHMAIVEDTPPQGVTRRLAGVIGWPRAIWSLVALSILAHGPLGDDEAYIGEVAVAPPSRREGIALALMQRVEAQARAVGKTRLTLWVTTDNGAARALYARLGFSPRARRTWFAGRLLFGSRGADLMEKRLSAADDPRAIPAK